jgi:predicted nucleotide-binding protein
MSNSPAESLQDLAFRLLVAIKEKTERSEEPVLVTQLAASLGADEADTKAAFQYLADKHLIKTYNLRFAARINAAGHDAIQEAIRDAAQRYSSQPDSVAERAIVRAIEQIATGGERPYKGNVPMLAQRILIQEGSGRTTDADAAERIYRAIESLQVRGELEAHAEGHLTWRLTDRIPKESRMTRSDAPQGSKIFIGHGRSMVWRDLKDFITDRLKLPHDEFNAEPVAGISNTERLTAMMRDAAFAFLVLTAEDEQPDGRKQARMNVIHEVGLFQGRLGFNRAIVLLEDGCEEFSNIAGLGQIRFPKGQIGAKFEEIRRVLEREGIVDA